MNTPSQAHNEISPKKMKLYRNHYSVEGGVSGGFSYHSTKRDAVLAASAFKTSEEKPLALAEPVTIIATQRGLIAALNKYAGHPDNG